MHPFDTINDLIDLWLVQDSYPEYDLFATIVHSGFSPDSGHYYAYIKVFLTFPCIFSLLDIISEGALTLFFC